MLHPSFGNSFYSSVPKQDSIIQKIVEQKMTQIRKSPFNEHPDPNQPSPSDPSQDWVCIKCNNLNFSFRKKCNRCKIQSRQDNHQVVYLDYYYYNQYYHYQPHTYEQKPQRQVIASDNALKIQRSPAKKSAESETLIEGKENRGLPSVSPLLKKYNDSQSKKMTDSSKMYWKGEPIEKLFGEQIWNAAEFQEVDFKELQKQLAITDDEQPKQEFIRSVEKMIV